ncbi:MAG: hypothetical protein B6U89_02285 [Desulfurococcales archaeon ex4484_58]|nr:MAG: hypothetical protein B6U89_02285 [Desulfurococcales archaeon ex4484_58]
MKNWRERLKGKGLLLALITRKPWLIPFIYHVHVMQGATMNELREILGLKSMVIKRALWWLTKNGIMVKAGEKYVIEQSYRKHVDELLLNTCTTGKRYVVKLGRTYFVAIVKRTRISTYTVLEKHYEELKNIDPEKASMEEVAKNKKLPVKIVSKTFDLIKTLKECRMK